MKAIVTGVSGQDGYYIARNLLDRGCEVVGLTSDPQKSGRIASELPDKGFSIEAFSYDRRGAFTELLARIRPDLVFNMAARATGQGMFDAPYEMSRLNGTFVLDILEAVRAVDPEVRVVQASSAEMFGDVETCPQNERTCFRPKSPYGAAKLYAHNLIGVYRRAFGLRCSAAILFNHESIRRTTDFVTRKIARAAAEIALGRVRRFSLGSIDAHRDWGYAPEYAEAMVRMAFQQDPKDYVLATGSLTSVARACEICFDHVGLDYCEYLDVDQSLQRTIQTINVCGDARAIYDDLGWKAETGIEQILTEMVDYDLRMLADAA